MEKVDIYNNKHEKVNLVKNRYDLEFGEYKLSSFIWIINENDEILVQKRVATKSNFPNMWGATAGAVRSNETSLDGAIREAKEELGIDISRDNVVFIGSYIRKRDFVEVFFTKKNINLKDIIIQTEEVQDVKWVNIEEFEKMIENGTGIITAYDLFKLYYKNYYKNE